MLATLAGTLWLYAVAPKGLFPQQDTGLIIGVAKAAPDISFDAMADRIQRLGRIVMADPDVDNVYCWIGEAGTLSQGRMLINLKPFADRDATADQIMTRLKRDVTGVEGIALYMQVRQDIQVGGRISATQYQYTLQDADVAELSKWSSILLDRLAASPELRDVTSDAQATRRVARRCGSIAIPRRGSASAFSPSTTCCTMRSASDRSRRCSPSSISITWSRRSSHGFSCPPTR